MKTKELGVIAVKLTGIACLIVALFKQQHVLLLLVNYYQIREHMAGTGHLVLSSILSLCFILIAGFTLLFAGNRIGRFITRDETEIPFPQDGNAVLRIGVAIIGIWVVAIAIPRVIEKISFVVLMNSEGMDTTRIHMKIRYLPELLAASIQTLIGTWMFLGNRGLIGIRNATRAAGHKKEKPTIA